MLNKIMKITIYNFNLKAQFYIKFHTKNVT